MSSGTEKGYLVINGEQGSYEDLQPEIRDLETPAIEVFENQYQDRRYLVSLECGKGELTSLCPKTGLPDFATLRVIYKPRQNCIELKSFKEYLLFYRDVGIFHEFLANKIADDIISYCDVERICVQVNMNPRGNISTEVVVSKRWCDKTSTYITH